MDEQVMKHKKRGHRALPRPAAIQLMEYGIRFFLGALLSGAQLFGSAPFGLCFVASSGAGLAGFSALLGTAFGYLSFHGLEIGLRYTATALLIFSVAFAFYDIRLYQKIWFMPLVACAMNGATGFVYLASAGWSGQVVAFFLTELLFTAAGVYFYRLALSPWHQPPQEGLTTQQLVSLLILAVTLLLALSRLTLLGGGVSLGQTLAALAVMCIASQSGLGLGAAAGLCSGLALDLAGGSQGTLTVIYGVSGLLCGVFHGRKRVACALAYLLTNAALTFWFWRSSSPPMNLLYDVFAASVLFLLLPNRLFVRLSTLLTRQKESDLHLPSQRHVETQLNATAGAFRELYESLKTTFRTDKTNDGDAAVIFDRAAERVCRSCALRDACWQRDYHATFTALNDALPALMARGRGEAEDFPPHFATRCLHFPKFVAAINEELTALLCRRQYHVRLRESRSAVCRQYGELSQLLTTAAHQLSTQLTPQPALEQRLRQHMSGLGIDAHVWVYQDGRGHLTARIEGTDLSALDTGPAFQQLARVLGQPLRMRQRTSNQGMDTLLYTQAEPLMAVLGVANRQKDGETISGDGQVWFKTPEGLLYVLLCDGMGSGPAANQDSGLALRLLERFLKAGVAPDEALKTLNAALALRSEEEGGFTTVDLLEIDLFTGHTQLYKLGAAPSYVKRAGVVSRITGDRLPAGLTTELTKLHTAPLLLAPGDSVVLVSDGVSDGRNDSWLRAALLQFAGSSPKDLARTLVESGQAPQDDRTALVVQLAAQAQ